jgi:hypothetical protein
MQVIFRNGTSNLWEKVNANDQTKLGHVIVSEVLDANTFVICGTIISSVSNIFNDGEWQYVNDNGTMTNVDTLDYSVPIGVAISETELLLYPFRPTGIGQSAIAYSLHQKDSDATVISTYHTGLNVIDLPPLIDGANSIVYPSIPLTAYTDASSIPNGTRFSTATTPSVGYVVDLFGTLYTGQALVTDVVAGVSFDTEITFAGTESGNYKTSRSLYIGSGLYSVSISTVKDPAMGTIAVCANGVATTIASSTFTTMSGVISLSENSTITLAATVTGNYVPFSECLFSIHQLV